MVWYCGCRWHVDGIVLKAPEERGQLEAAITVQGIPEAYISGLLLPLGNCIGSTWFPYVWRWFGVLALAEAVFWGLALADYMPRALQLCICNYIRCLCPTNVRNAHVIFITLLRCPM